MWPCFANLWWNFFTRPFFLFSGYLAALQNAVMPTYSNFCSRCISYYWILLIPKQSLESPMSMWMRYCCKNIHRAYLILISEAVFVMKLIVFLETLIQRMYLCIVEMNNFWGDFTDVSAKTQTVVIVNRCLVFLRCQCKSPPIVSCVYRGIQGYGQSASGPNENLKEQSSFWR